LKRCPECAREIEDSAAACEACAAWAASLLPGSTPPSTDDAEEVAPPAPPPHGEAAASPAGSRAGRRELLFVAVGLGGAALVTFALLMMRGGASSNVSAAAAAPAPRTPSAPAAATVSVQKWTTDTRAYWTGNQRHAAAFEVQADNIVQTWFGPVRPSLVVRCTARSIQTFVFTGSPMKIEPHADGKTVTVSVDDEPVRTERWPDSDDHDALFAPDGAAFVQRLLRAHTLRFGYSPHNANDVVAHFHVSGLAELIDPVAKECGWTK
jgi:hypothetical protein